MMVTAMEEPRINLEEPLPEEVPQRVSRRLAAYRNYPVFSWRWLAKRTLLFTILVGCSGGVLTGFMVYGLSRLGTGLTRQDLMAALQVGILATLNFMLMCTLGPFLATIVRQLGLRLRTERVLVVLALLSGLITIGLLHSRSEGDRDTDTERSAYRPQKGDFVPAPVGDMNSGRRAYELLKLVALYVLLGGGVALRRYWSEPRRMKDLLRERELANLRAQKQETDLRLGVLQAQVEPHFLFNTLASVRSLIASDPGLAQATIDALVDYLRATIPRLRDGAVQVSSTLGQQLEICESYLKLMQVRMGGRLTYEVDIDPALRTASFPPLLLLNLVENAIKHGIEPKPGPGRVSLRASIDPERLAVNISDDGAGLRDDFGSGVGLSNVREQLRARYGDRASLALTGGPGRGTMACIVVPREADV